MSEHPSVGELGIDPATYDDVEQVVDGDEDNDDPNYNDINDETDGREPPMHGQEFGPFSGKDPA